MAAFHRGLRSNLRHQRKGKEMDWQGIESAPKDGSGFIGYNQVTGANQMAWDGNKFFMAMWGGAAGIWYPSPTHWMELPEPPK